VELLRALGALAEDTGPAQRRIAEALGLGELDPADYTELFSFALYPYASVYLGPEGMLGGEARDRIAGFWRALGLVPPEEPDHLAVLLALYAQLVERVAEEDDPLRRAAIENARAAFFWEHLASWLPVYLAKAQTLAHGAYAQWAQVLAATLEAEAVELPRPAALPLHLREVASLADGDVGGGNGGDDGLVAALLAPARTGLILVRADLRRIAEAMGIALRQGERRYALDALLVQDRMVVLRELRLLALEAAASHAALPATFAQGGREWERRALATAASLAVACSASERVHIDD